MNENINTDEFDILIKEFKQNNLTRMYNGIQYYKGKNTAILQREKTFFNIAQGMESTDYTKANNKLSSGFTRIIIDQKVFYSINKGLVITKELDDILKLNKFKKDLRKLALNASKEIYGVLYWYIEDKELKYKILPSQQIIIKYNENDEKEIDYILRVYKQNKIDTIDYIDSYAVTTFQKDEESNEWKIVNGPKPHIVIKTSSNNIVYNENIVSWGKVPVSVLYNNDTEQTDLEMFKSDIDAYDIIKSDFINSFEDFQELYWILKGYDGQDPAQFMKEFKMSRILKVSEDGDAKQVSQEVPYEARQTALNILKIDIFRFAMAVDLEGLKGDTTNLTIKAMFSNLDLKANSFEDQIEEFIYSVNYFVDKYQEIT